MDELLHNFNRILDEKREEIIAIAAAKKKFDKREDSKKRDAEREIRRKYRV